MGPLDRSGPLWTLDEISIRPVRALAFSSTLRLLILELTTVRPALPLLAFAVWDSFNLIRAGTMLISPNALLAGTSNKHTLPPSVFLFSPAWKLAR